MTVTPEVDARWALKCFEREKEQARVAVEAANARFLRANRGYMACLRKLKDLGVEYQPDMIRST